MTSGSKH